MDWRSLPQRPYRSGSLGDNLFTVTTSSPDQASPLGSSPLVTLLLGVAIGAGAAGLIFSWK